MNKKEHLHRLTLPFAVLLGSLLAIALLFLFTYRWDNKYTAAKSAPVYVLADGWEFYPGFSYTPGQDLQEIQNETPSLITLGEFGNFSAYNEDGSPFGSAVYRKVLSLEYSPDGWLLEMPEIFSASRIYVNGVLVREYGALSEQNYKIHIQNTLLMLPAGQTELIIQTSNYSHYYSGMVYPPVLGETDAVMHLVICRIIFYALLCFFTLGCSIVSFSVWFRKKTDLLYAAFGTLCLCFAVHISYPLIHWLGINAQVLPYVIEDTAYFAVLSCMTVLTWRLTGTPKYQRLYACFYAFSVCMVLFPVTAFYIIFPIFPAFVNAYSFIIGISKLFMSLFLIVPAFTGTVQNPSRVWLLSGNAVFGAGILVDYLTASLFEPLRFGWQTEYCGFIMVLLFTVLFVKYNRKVITEKEFLTEHLQDEVQRKTAWLTSLVEERKQFLSAVAHDLKAPVAAINTYIDYIRGNEFGSDEEMQHYLDIIDHKSAQIQSDVQSLQLFHTDSTQASPPTIIDCTEFLRLVYEETLPYTEACGIHFHPHLPTESFPIYGQKENLFRAFENLIINATEHTPFEGILQLDVNYTDSAAHIEVTDNGEGISPEFLDQIFQYGFSTKGKKGLCGLGLYFTKINIEEFGGSISVSSNPGIRTTFYISFPKALNHASKNSNDLII